MSESGKCLEDGVGRSNVLWGVADCCVLVTLLTWALDCAPTILAGDAGARGRPAVRRDQQHAVPRRRSQGEDRGVPCLSRSLPTQCARSSLAALGHARCVPQPTPVKVEKHQLQQNSKHTCSGPGNKPFPDCAIPGDGPTHTQRQWRLPPGQAGRGGESQHRD